MDLPAAQPVWPACEPVGKYFLDLISDPLWVRRRVETVELTSTVRFERRVSLDIDVIDLVARAEASGIHAPSKLFLPLTLFEKRLLIDFDVVDSTGKTLSLVTSDEDSHAALAVILATADSLGVDPSGFSAGMVAKLYDIVRNSPDPVDAAIIANASSVEQRQYVSGWNLRNASRAEEIAWRAVFAQPNFAGRVAEFTTHYMPIVSIPAEPSPQVIKYRTVESELITDTSGWTWGERIGWDRVYFAVATPSIGRARREHVRIDAPRGVFAVSADVRTVTGEAEQGPLTPQTSGDTFLGRVTPERALVYTQGRTESGGHEVVVGFRPAVTGFRTPAVLGALFSALILLAGAAGQWVRGFLGTIAEHSAEPAVALLIVIPSLLAAYLVREEEHEIRSKLLAIPRYFVGGTSVLTLIAAIAMIAQFSGHTLAYVWVVCGGLCFLTLCFLAVVCWRIARSHQAVVERSYLQFSKSIEEW
ncbi:hypothetical protein [Mycobacterium sp. 852002-51057_SCH5723018]|uniref:hypothetical protein n=1 Tax=Mycobacterium sp. 852002-51057_SCH5723018 TaxID=1834094 RepID=UPI0012E938C6|nr:hypothetical protein [Mycobacterium sp. 852002-51057_SCH5723018]